MNGLVSVALAAYRGTRYLEEQVNSILRQSHSDLELIILDDASADQTFTMIEKLAAKDLRIKPYRNEKTLGLVLNFMKAVSLCRGEFVAYCDQDDVWEIKKIETLLRALGTTPQNMLAYSDLEIFDESLRVSRGSFWGTSKIAPFTGNLGERALLKNISPGCSMLFRRQVADMISECYRSSDFTARNSAAVLDETPFMHDHLAQVIGAGLGRLVYTPEKLVRYRQHSSNSIGAFYQARDSREGSLRCLSMRLEAMKPYRSRLTGMDWEKMGRFADRYGRSERAPMLEFLPYFFFLRNNSLPDRFLGGVDCFFPSFYKKVKSYVKNS